MSFTDISKAVLDARGVPKVSQEAPGSSQGTPGGTSAQNLQPEIQRVIQQLYKIRHGLQEVGKTCALPGLARTIASQRGGLGISPLGYLSSILG